jgi:hypothetical protein
MENSNSSNTGADTSTAPVVEATAPTEGQPQQAQPTKAEIRKMKLKIDGQETEMGEDEVIRYAQQGKAANQRFQEAAKMRKEAEDMVNLIKRDPRAVLEDPRIGINFRELAEQYLSEQLKLEMMTPEQKKYHEAEQKLRGYQDAEKAQKAQVEAKQSQQLQEHYANEYSNTITEALKTQGVPKSPSTVKRMAALMSKSIDNGLDLQPSQIAKLVQEEYLAEIKELFGSSDEDTLLALLGDDTANKIRKADLKRLRGGNKPVEQFEVAKPNQKASRVEPSKRKQSPDDYFASLKKKY